MINLVFIYGLNYNKGRNGSFLLSAATILIITAEIDFVTF